MTPEQKSILREKLMTAEINPSWSGYGSLQDMFFYFCPGESIEKDGEYRSGEEVVMDRIMDIIEEIIMNNPDHPSK